MKHIPEYYQLIEQNERFVNNFTIKVCLKEKVNEKILCEAAQKAIVRFPYFAVMVTANEQGDYDIRHNDLPIAVIKRNSEKLILGSSCTNGHLLAIEYDDYNFYFSINHALAGGSGLMNYIKAVVFIYFSELKHEKYDDTEFMLPGKEMLPGERDYPTLEALAERDGLPSRKIEPGFFPRADHILAHQHPEKAYNGYYQIKLRQEDVMHYVRSSDGSPCASVSVLMFKALEKIIPESEGDFNAHIAHNYQSAVGCPNTTQDLVRKVVVHYDRSWIDKTDEMLGTITRGQIIAETLPERAVADARVVLSNNEAVDSFETLKEKKEFLASHNRHQSGINCSYIISYAGNIRWGDLEKYVDAVYTITMGHLMLEINAIGDRICISFQISVQKDEYIQGFLKELDHAGISYEVSGPFEKNLPGLQI